MVWIDRFLQFQKSFEFREMCSVSYIIFANIIFNVMNCIYSNILNVVIYLDIEVFICYFDCGVNYIIHLEVSARK